MRRGLLKCCPVLLQGRQIRGTVPWPPEPSKGRAEGSHPTSCWWRPGLLNLHHRTSFATHLLSPPQFYPEKKVQKSQLNSRLFFFFFNKKTSLFPMKFSKYACLRIEAPLPASSSRDAGFSPLQQEQAGSHFLGDCSTRFRRTEQPLCQDPWQMLARRQGSSWSSEHSVTAHCQALQQGALTQT